MKQQSNFFPTENTLLSVILHLAVAALVVTAAVFIVPPEKIVAPARVQIYEMDLRNVKIVRDETLVYNTDFPNATNEKRETKNEIKPTNTPKPDWQADKNTVPDNNPPAPDKADKTDAPVADTRVRVNRETAPLVRTMTVSVVDALRVYMTRCWQFDKTRDGINDIRAVAHMTLSKNGMVSDLWFETAARADSDPAFAYILETIRTAVANCEPFRMLPPNEYDAWRNVQLTFYPSSATVM